jgi:hypothetical protein
MKKSTLGLVVLSLLVGAALSAQQIQMPPGPGPGEQIPPQMLARRMAPQMNQAPDAPPLKNNVTLSIKGTMIDIPIDLSCTGTGPRFNITTILSVLDNKQPIIGRFSATLTPTDDGYHVDYELACQYPIVTSSTASADPKEPPHDTVSYANLSTSSSANLKPDQPLVVINNNGKTVSITISDADQSAAK